MSVSALMELLLVPGLLPAALLTLGVLLVNGWTDAPNAIATAVASGALPFSAAAALAAVCDLLGALLAAGLFPAVTETVLDLARFGGDRQAALWALCAALGAVVLWSTAAWVFGLPTSESHGLLAGLTGAALALEDGAVDVRAWTRVLLALPLSMALGWLLAKALTARPGKPRSASFCRLAQRVGAAAMALLHGAQDGQKFLGIFLLGLSLALCAGSMALGTALGGRRIVDTVGRDMVALDPSRGLAADLAGAGSLLVCTLLGLPVSTTHTKTAAILGAGRRPDWSVARSIALAWALTFPVCGLLGFLGAKFLLFFL